MFDHIIAKTSLVHLCRKCDSKDDRCCLAVARGWYYHK